MRIGLCKINNANRIMQIKLCKINNANRIMRIGLFKSNDFCSFNLKNYPQILSIWERGNTRDREGMGL